MANEARVLLEDLLASLPPEYPEALLPLIREKVRESGRKVVVLDDDPTGTQTVHDVPVLTEWPVERLAAELNGESPAFYLLTNSRGLPLAQAQSINAEIGHRLRHAAGSGPAPAVVSRSDSTLRGHFPGEVAALASGLGEDFDGWLIAPYFLEGGRYTVNDVHYVLGSDGWLTPSGQTEFARDKTFGYQASNLREWVAEKTGGSTPAGQVATITIEELRLGGPQAVARRLASLPRGAICAANAASDRDLEVLVLGLLEAEASGRRYLYRTAASFVRVRAGIAQRPLLTAADLQLPEQGAGLIIAGSYVPRTSAQLEALFDGARVQAVEVRVPRLLDEAARGIEVQRAREEVDRLLRRGEDTAVYTSRQLVSVEGSEANLALGQHISNSLVDIVRGMQARPRYLLAKGGITSSDVATQGLGIRRAVVLGQILPGVPVWRAGPESRQPGLAYIVFPGNVGGPDALAQIVNSLQGA